LTDEEPEQRQESPEARVLSLERLRESVRRDLTWLFNASGLEAVQDLSAYPDVEHSTLNFGIPDLTGRPISTIDTAAVARRLRRAIWDFEPRLLRQSVNVRPVERARSQGPSTLCFAIEAELWSEPVPIRLLLRTELNLESGDARIIDSIME
jgi:type VI secretion system protein ImpF